MDGDLRKKIVSFVLYEESPEKKSTYDLIRCHTLMILVLVAQIVNLKILKSSGIEPWLLLTYRCFGALTFVSLLSIFVPIRDPIPVDFGTTISSYSHSIGQLFILILHYIHESEDGKKSYCSMILLTFLLVFGSLHEFNHIFFRNIEAKRKLFWKLFKILLVISSTFFSFPEILKFEYLVNNFNRVFLWSFVLIVTIISKLMYYFGIIKINSGNIKPFEVSASNALSISKLGIPIGIFVHAYRIKKLLPNREFSQFIFDALRCDRKTALYLLISSGISFGFVLPIQVINFSQISLFEYSIYSIAPSILTSGSVIGIFLLSVVIVMQIFDKIHTNQTYYSKIQGIKMTEVK
ncbi:hypothetical protein FG386_002436 [Cryptosporidium ryanae]|uniref:uncharacterized protein n=1 Tax=Cryptosporidium ryanae TaxID=515981 RepID=UPI003519E958|nr:hypothetical protein FG386_002436 [Cryptosporidium ryanae]